VDPVTVATTIDRPREEVFDYLADIANHPEFMDHFTERWHLTREDSYGLGAGARFHVRRRMKRFSWADVSFVEVDRPRRIVEVGRTGKFNRIRTLTVFELEPGSGGQTRVELTMETENKTPSDRLLEAVGTRGFFKRRLGRSLRRLRSILEDDRDRGSRVTVAAGGPRKPASGFHFTEG
jgi:uncharacterized protein YndB with AHSA1/START domain